MAEGQAGPNGPDLTNGIILHQIADGGALLGHVGDDNVLLVRRGTQVFAVGAYCSHYNGPLADGLIVGDTVRCPWHHACFDLRTGEALRAPAFSPVASWLVETRDDRIFVRERRKLPETRPSRNGASKQPKRIVLVGGGAAGFAAAEMLRREKYQGEIVMLSSDDAPPVDRPNLSKDFLAGSAPEEWVALRPVSFYSEHGIDLRLNANVLAIDPRARKLALADGSEMPFDRLLLATGAEPSRLSIPGADAEEVRVLRSLADCRAIIESAKNARQVVVLGASFIGLEVAAALRGRGIEVHVVAPENRPMERVWAPN
jgi:apoptosis-inducing factor 3